MSKQQQGAKRSPQVSPRNQPPNPNRRDEVRPEQESRDRLGNEKREESRPAHRRQPRDSRQSRRKQR